MIGFHMDWGFLGGTYLQEPQRPVVAVPMCTTRAASTIFVTKHGLPAREMGRVLVRFVYPVHSFPHPDSWKVNLTGRSSILSLPLPQSPMMIGFVMISHQVCRQKAERLSGFIPGMAVLMNSTM